MQVLRGSGEGGCPGGEAVKVSQAPLGVANRTMVRLVSEHGLNVCVSPNSQVESVPCDVMASRGRTFEVTL